MSCAHFFMKIDMARPPNQLENTFMVVLFAISRYIAPHFIGVHSTTVYMCIYQGELWVSFWPKFATCIDIVLWEISYRTASYRECILLLYVCAFELGRSVGVFHGIVNRPKFSTSIAVVLYVTISCYIAPRFTGSPWYYYIYVYLCGYTHIYAYPCICMYVSVCMQWHICYMK